MILALETSTTASSAALCRPDGEIVAERVDLDGPAHTQRLLPFVHEVLTGTKTTWAEIDTIVCGLGPGAYTGMRIGVATARALAQATGARLGGVPTLAAVALELAQTATPDAPLLALLDGKRREVFAACYRASGHGLVEAAPLAVVPADELPGYAAGWPGAAIGGDGALLYADLLSSGADVAGDAGGAFIPSVGAPTAAMVARAWLARVPGVRESFDEVLPIYGRDPDAAKWAGRAGA